MKSSVLNQKLPGVYNSKYMHQSQNYFVDFGNGFKVILRICFYFIKRIISDPMPNAYTLITEAFTLSTCFILIGQSGIQTFY